MEMILNRHSYFIERIMHGIGQMIRLLTTTK